MAVHEEAVRDRDTGRHINADLAGYHVAANASVPDIKVDFVPDHEPDVAGGVTGCGEIGTPGTAAAIANAVWHATGRPHQTLPIRLDRVIEPDSPMPPARSPMPFAGMSPSEPKRLGARFNRS